MKKQLAAVFVSGLAIAALSGTASAGGSKGAIGVGAESSLGAVSLFDGDPVASRLLSVGISGLSINYDAGQFHAGGLLGFVDGGGDDDTFVAIGGRFYYHIHSTAMSDFGIGGNVAMGFFDDGNDDNDNDTFMLLEPGIQTRAFVTSNVALSFSAGLTIGLLDANGVAVSAQPTGAAGVHYYFF